MGRLRADTPYQGSDPTMPKDGPRWFMVAANPTGNWVYYKFIKPMHDYRKGIISPELIVDPDTGLPLISLFEGSTYDNAHNLKADYIKGLEATYRGQMRDRYLLGKWASYEGLVYPMVTEDTHFVDHDTAIAYLHKMRENRYFISWVEGYDHGLSSPTCYLLGFVDDEGNVIWIDGFHKAEMSIAASAERIRMLRMLHGVPDDHVIDADPAIFRRTGTSDTRIVGKTVAGMYHSEHGIQMRRGNNDIINGIAKVQGYLNLQQYHRNPFTGQVNAPFMYFSRRLEFVRKEIFGYHWQRQKSTGQIMDKPSDKNDHAMDVIKYATGSKPQVSELVSRHSLLLPAAYMWHVVEGQSKQERDKRSSRHG
jgi:hypothetical protein